MTGAYRSLRVLAGAAGTPRSGSGNHRLRLGHCDSTDPSTAPGAERHAADVIGWTASALPSSAVARHERGRGVVPGCKEKQQVCNAGHLEEAPHGSGRADDGERAILARE